MITEPENLVLELLRAIRADIGDLRHGQQELLMRVGRVESGIAGIRRDQGSDAEATAHVQAQVDRMRERLERIERRLDIID